MYTLYYAPGTCSLATLIALEEVGARYETVKLDFSAQEQRSAAYLAVNPKGRVPSLLTDRGILTETPAILAFLAARHPEARLMPEDPFLLAKVQEFNAYLCSTVHINHAHGPRAARWADEAAAQAEMRRKVPQTMQESFALIEEHFLVGPWVMGEDYSTADPYLFTVCRWLAKDGVDVSKLPNVSAHIERMSGRASVQRALQAEGRRTR